MSADALSASDSSLLVDAALKLMSDLGIPEADSHQPKAVFVLQSLHELRPGNTACTMSDASVPVVMRIEPLGYSSDSRRQMPTYWLAADGSLRKSNAVEADHPLANSHGSNNVMRPIHAVLTC